MTRPALRLGLALIAALALAACGGKDEAAAPSTAAAPAQTPAAAPAAPGTVADPTPAASPGTDTAPAAAEAPAADTATATAATESPASAPSTAPVAPATPPAPPSGPAPREGTDYTLIDPPQPLNEVPGKVEIAEVFSYTCIHCSRLDGLLPAWKASLPANIDFVYVPMAHGSFEQIARGFHAAQALGVQERTHGAMFKAMAEQHRVKQGTAEEVAALYAGEGVDEDTMLATMKSFGISATIARTQKAIARWAVESTPTLIVAGKYRVVVTADRGHQGMLDAARWLAEKELAEAGTQPAS